jgi:Lamin Tail Domain
VKARAYDTGTSTWSALSEVTYLVDAEPASAANLAISELQYHPAVTLVDLPLGYNDDTFFEYVELMNIGPKTVDLMGIRFSDGLTWEFDATATAPRLLAPGQRAVVVGHTAAFIHRHGNTPVRAGQFTGQIDNGGELLTLRAANDAIIRTFTYDDIAPWPTAPDGTGPSMVLIRPETNPDHALAANWRASYNSGNPGGPDAFAYSTWKAANAPGQADNDDADNDGLTTFWEYASGGTPGQNNSSLLPTAGLESVTVGMTTDQYQTLTAIIRLGTDDLQLFPESGNNLTSWSTADMVQLRRTDNGDGTETITWRHARPWKADLRLFMRLRGLVQ